MAKFLNGKTPHFIGWFTLILAVVIQIVMVSRGWGALEANQHAVEARVTELQGQVRHLEALLEQHILMPR